MECDVPKGWHHWGGLTCTNYKGMHLGGTYNYLNASQWRANFDATGQQLVGKATIKIWNGVHQSEFLGNQTVEQAAKAVAAGKPFFIHTTPVMVHGGTCAGPQPQGDYDYWDPYWEHHNPDPTPVGPEGEPKGTMLTGSPCPTRKHAWNFNGLTNPHVPSWGVFQNGTVPDNIAEAGDPDTKGCCDEWEAGRQDMVYRNRTAAVVDLDDMLSTIFNGLEGLRVLESTYIFFSSDNGFHLGEHRLLFGKTKPYATDVRLPMYVRGPDVPAGQVRWHPTTHIDITATIAELAGGAARYSPHPIDGLSFAAVLKATPPPFASWRDFSFSEFYVGQNTWRNIRMLGADGQPAWAFHFWCSNQTEVYKEAVDPWQMNNLGLDTAFGAKIVSRYLSATEMLGACVGKSCHTMPAAVPASANPLPCHDPGELLAVAEAWMD
mmetsp:Transcript_35537/g.58889  ORF Transcript_35537/g.58889 Transcript_35537/m.58889 type:complete len:434 (+) Transcript_35537:2-1303(+)|eukprot:CAMPEP_0119340846 /NCGR_PEP_ID=MMETSP1333-20130426/101135_1 /TAXON_ID=418940 /ORGANISM="Scyphosphaera apsteinii, Strain RCC1455" /LENGTH=433 /DNA_ID=CAMNT_0007352687 /DNA_START=1 /DNA_END=1302 /DNA_ORIENTATION=-